MLLGASVLLVAVWTLYVPKSPHAVQSPKESTPALCGDALVRRRNAEQAEINAAGAANPLAKNEARNRRLSASIDVDRYCR